MSTVFFYKNEGLPHEISEANKSTRVAIAGILVRRSSKSGFFDLIFFVGVKWIRYDKTKRKQQLLDPGEVPKPTPKPDIHRKKG